MAILGREGMRPMLWKECSSGRISEESDGGCGQNLARRSVSVQRVGVLRLGTADIKKRKRYGALSRGYSAI